MKVEKYARDLNIGDKLYHWDGEEPAETIKDIKQAYNGLQDGSQILNTGHLVIKCQTFNMLVHRNDIRKIEL